MAVNEKAKAEYMIELLDLKNKELNKMRKESYLSIIEISNNQDIENVLDENNKYLPGFFSMLKQFFLID